MWIHFSKHTVMFPIVCRQQSSLLGFGTEPLFQQCIRLKFDMVLFILQVYVSYDYGTTFTHVSEKFQLSGDQEGKKQVISQFYHSPADNKRVSVWVISWTICVKSFNCLVFVSLSWGQTRPRWHQPFLGHLQLWPSTTPITYTPTDGVFQESSSKGWAKTEATCLVSALGTHRNELLQWVSVRCRGSWEKE